MLTGELIRRGARQHANRTAILFGDERLTFAEVDVLAARMANVFRARGLDRVGLLLDNGLYSVPVDFACVKANLPRVPLNSRLTVAEQEQMLRGLDVRVLVHGASQAERAAELAGRTHVEMIEVESALLPLARDASADEPDTDARPDDTLLLLYTSGTTGKLKAVRHTQASYAAVVANMLANLVEPHRDDVFLHAASLIHASGTFVLPFWMRGAANAVLPGFVPADFLAAIPRYGVTHTNMVPTMLAVLLAAPELETTDLSRLRRIFYGASPMPLPVIERALARFGPILAQYYGQTEAPLCIAVLRPEEHEGDRLLSCGQPSVDCEVRLDAKTNEILVRAPFAAAGYVGDDELHRQTFQKGWVRTRDVGRFDEEGYLYLIDRTSDMIVTGGYNVYPREVEDVLLAHSAVRECAVVAGPDEKWVEVVTAFVVAADGATEDELIEHCRAQLAGYKVPKSIRFITEIPKSAVGKVLRRALREPLWRELGSRRQREGAR